MVLNVLLWIHVQSFFNIYKYIVLPPLGLGQWMPIQRLSFLLDFYLQPQHGCSENVQESVRQRQRHTERVLSFEMPCAIVLPPFLAAFSFFFFFSFHPLFFKLQMPKIKPTDTTLPQWLLPRAFSQWLLIFFSPLRLFLPCFSYCLGHNFQMTFIMGMCCQSWLFVKQKKSLKDKSQYLKM